MDQALQVHMLRAMADVLEPGIAVLLTGDGAGSANGVGFHADLERMYAKGWGVEVISWKTCCNARMQRWAEQVGVVIKLEDYIDQIVFEQSVTNVAKINLTRRSVVSP